MLYSMALDGGVHSKTHMAGAPRFITLQVDRIDNFSVWVAIAVTNGVDLEDSGVKKVINLRYSD